MIEDGINNNDDECSSRLYIPPLSSCRRVQLTCGLKSIEMSGRVSKIDGRNLMTDASFNRNYFHVTLDNFCYIFVCIYLVIVYFSFS